MLFRRIYVALTMCCLIGAQAFAFQPPANPQNEFVPIENLPASAISPAEPYVVAAYAFVWLAVMFYLWTIWKRMNRVESEMRTLAQKTARP
jgi:CcmD family protein